VEYLEATTLKRARWLSKSLYHLWKSAPETIAYLQLETDVLALQVGDYLTALNEVFRKYSRRHSLRYFYSNERPDPVKLFDTLRPPRESAPEPSPVANACIQILTPNNPSSIAYYIASKRLGLEVEYQTSLLNRVFGEPEGCSSALKIKVATEPLLEADLFLVHGKAGRYVIRTEHTAYIFQVESSNVPVPIDPVAHALFLHPPLPCRPADYVETEEPAFSKLLPGTSIREAFISRDSILIPSFSGRVIHWWLSRPLTTCELLQAKGFSYETAKDLTERFARRYLKIDIDPVTASLQIQSFLRAKGVELDGGDHDYYAL